MTESTADIQPVQVGYSGVRLLPVPLKHRDNIYAEHEISCQELVHLIRQTGQPARTLPVADDVVASVFEEALQKSSQVVHVASGSRFTPHYQVATRVAQAFGQRVTVLDGGTVSYALGVQALHAAHLADQRADLAQIVAALEELRPRTLLSFAVESLDFLRVNGRIGSAAALVGGWLKLRPILAVEHEEVVSKGRGVRGHDAAIRHLLLTTHRFQQALGEPLRLYCGYTVEGEDAARDLEATLRQSYPGATIRLHPLGSGLTANVGPGMVAVLAFPARFELGYA